LFLVDDNIFVGEFRVGDAVELLDEDPKLLGVSLRLGENTTHSYPQNRRQNLPKFSAIGDGVLVYDWTTAELDFGYPLEVSSSVYRLRDVLPLAAGLSFANPNVLEDRMAFNAHIFRRRYPLLGCFRSSVTFCNVVNVVQTAIPNRSGESSPYSVNELAARFDRGERIRVEAFSGFVPSACHQEVSLVFGKSGS
jgi:hypothetical protein